MESIDGRFFISCHASAMFCARARSLAPKCLKTHGSLSSSVPQLTKVEKIVLDSIKACHFVY